MNDSAQPPAAAPVSSHKNESEMSSNNDQTQQIPIAELATALDANPMDRTLRQCLLIQDATTNDLFAAALVARQAAYERSNGQQEKTARGRAWLLDHVRVLLPVDENDYQKGYAVVRQDDVFDSWIGPDSMIFGGHDVSSVLGRKWLVSPKYAPAAVSLGRVILEKDC